MKNGWVVRAGQGGSAVRRFLDAGVVAMAGAQLGDLNRCRSVADIRALYESTFPSDSKYTRDVRANQLARFVLDVRVGDPIVTPGAGGRVFLLGTVASGYEWAASVVPELPHIRRVTWERAVRRQDLSTGTLNTLGSISALFSLPAEVVEELQQRGIPLDQAGAALSPAALGP